MSAEDIGEYTFKWKIMKFSCYNLEMKENISSPVFDIEELNKSQWQVHLSSNKEYPRAPFSCFLSWIKTRENIEAINIDLSLEIWDDNKNVCEVTKTYKDLEFHLNEWKLLGWHELVDNNSLQANMRSRSEDSLTLKFRFRSNELKSSIVTGTEALTTIDVKGSTVVWDLVIPKCFKHSEILAFSISSEYQIEVTLSYMQQNIDMTIRVLNHYYKKPGKITFEFCIFDKIGCKLSSKRMILTLATKTESTTAAFVTKELLEACRTEKNQYQFKLKCDAYIFNNSMSSSIVQNLSFKSTLSLDCQAECGPSSDFLSNIQRMFISKKDSDATIKVGNREFLAHKFVLRARSHVLDEMLDKSMQENQTSVVEITDIDCDTFNVFLKYLYTDNVDMIDLDIAKMLIIAAHKYGVPSLVDKCATFMKSVFSIKNVCEIMAIADMLNCKNLKSSALNYIRVNATEILLSSDWSDWIKSNIDLAAYILSKLTADYIQEKSKAKQ